MLDDLDKLLEQRGLRFVRYADDCNVYVRSERAGQRVMAGLKAFLTSKLKLKVNEAKSAVARPHTRKFLGFTFSNREQVARRIAPKALARFKDRIRELTQRTRGIGVDQMIGTLKRYLTGWRGYFGYCETPGVLRKLDEWIRRRIRCFFWKQWKHRAARFRELTTRGVNRNLAARTVGSPHGVWRLSCSPALSIALSNRYFRSLGLPSVGS
ncbi:group II intron maturase-specific domain-containing protein [Paraburkholderia oxyphila]|uniref:group II intron maturase-specific domain-containing protein n=1 Tax=Paraburkholderia oxyphila TaxID=614212 RepID=UPI0005BD0A32|nr:group II intron maturase-specific domain-containing protein [Paraburkholderia oxyphila]